MGLAEKGDAMEEVDPCSVLFSSGVQEKRESMLQAYDDYLREHGAARGEWAPLAGARRLGLSALDTEEEVRGGAEMELKAKGFHQHFNDLSAEFEGLVLGGPIYTKDRVAREADRLVRKGGDELDKEVDSAVAALRRKVGGRVEASEVDDWGWIHLGSDIPERELRKRVFPYRDGPVGVMAAAEALAQRSEPALHAEVDAVLRELRGEILGSGPTLSAGASVQNLQDDVALLKQWVGRLKTRKEPEKTVSFTGQVRKIREARLRARCVEEDFQERGGEALAERTRLTMVGRDRPVPKGFSKTAFEFLSKSQQDKIVASTTDMPGASCRFAYPYPDPAVPYPTTMRAWPAYTAPRVA